MSISCKIVLTTVAVAAVAVIAVVAVVVAVAAVAVAVAIVVYGSSGNKEVMALFFVMKPKNS